MTTSIFLLIDTQVKEAMRAKDTHRLGVLRMMKSAILKHQIDQGLDRGTLPDDQILAILEKMVKQHADSITQFETVGRKDSAEKERLEMAVVQSFLPERLPSEEVAAIIKSAITEHQATSMKDMGKVMAAVKPKLQGRADMTAVSAQIKQALS